VDHSLQGKVVLVTGASSGIGQATALALPEVGANVAVGGRRADRLADLAKRAPGEVLTLDLDVTDKQSRRAAVAATVERFGGLDVLVNCRQRNPDPPDRQTAQRGAPAMCRTRHLTILDSHRECRLRTRGPYTHRGSPS
jgi:NAD(P)-dependent dehydrogenase (short-subunit alcohol dehydrogenase family)